MQLGRVVGHATSTVKHASMNGCRLLIVQLLGTSDDPDGEPVLVIDQLGAGAGMKVLVTTDALLIREMVKTRNSPIRYSVMGLCDE